MRSKRQMFELFERGEFGNKLRTWSSVDEYMASDFAGIVSLRYAGKGGGGWVSYDVPRDEIWKKVQEWESEGAERSRVKVSESAPDERITIQGEVCYSPFGGGLALRFSDFKGKMRDAMRWADHVWGVEALVVLRDYLTPSSFDDIRDLLDIYPDAVVEFSAYEMPLGSCKGRNAIVWEVRNY